MKTLTEQIQEGLNNRAVIKTKISDIEKVGDDLVIFKADETPFWGKLTKTGKLKKNSIRLNTQG